MSKTPFVIPDDYMDTQYALSSKAVIEMYHAGHLTVYNSYGLDWKDYGDRLPDFAQEWYYGEGWYIDSGSVYQSMKPERILAMYTKAHNVRRVGFRGGRWMEWRCEIDVNGRMVDFYARTRNSTEVPRNWNNKAHHEKYIF